MVSTTKKKKQSHTSPRNKKKRYRTRVLPQKLSVKPKKLWVVQPTSSIFLKFIEETFTYKGKSLNPEKLPINDFIKHYDKQLERVDRGWLKKIVGNLTPFITFLSSSFAKQNDNIETSITFFESQLYSIPSRYHQIRKDLGEDKILGNAKSANLWHAK